MQVLGLDLANRVLKLAIEYDDAEWHSSTDQQKHDRERRKYLARVHGWTFVVVVCEDLFGRDQVLLEARIRQAVVEARRRHGIRPLR